MQNPNVVKRGEARNTDILCGRGNGVLCHPGNIYYLKLIKKHQHMYQHGRGGMQSLSQREKRKIVRHIIETIDQLEPPGRFLKLVGRDTEHGFEEIYHVIEDEDTRMKKVSQALREKPKKSTLARERQQQLLQRQNEEGAQTSNATKSRRNAATSSKIADDSSSTKFFDSNHDDPTKQRYMAMFARQHQQLIENNKKNNGSMTFHSPPSDGPGHGLGRATNNHTPKNDTATSRAFYSSKRRLPYSEALRHPDTNNHMMGPHHKRRMLQHPSPPPHSSRHPNNGNFHMPRHPQQQLQQQHHRQHLLHRHHHNHNQQQQQQPHQDHSSSRQQSQQQQQQNQFHNPNQDGRGRFNMNELSNSMKSPIASNVTSFDTSNGGSNRNDEMQYGGNNKRPSYDRNDSISMNERNMEMLSSMATTKSYRESKTEEHSAAASTESNLNFENPSENSSEMNNYNLNELKRSNEEMKERYRRTLVDCVRLAEMIQRSEIAQSEFSANQLQSQLRNLHSMATTTTSTSSPQNNKDNESKDGNNMTGKESTINDNDLHTKKMSTPLKQEVNCDDSNVVKKKSAMDVFPNVSTSDGMKSEAAEAALLLNFASRANGE